MTWLQTPRMPTPPTNPYNFGGRLEDLASLPDRQPRAAGTLDRMPLVNPSTPTAQTLGLNALIQGHL
jgi:hypothetical protein